MFEREEEIPNVLPTLLILQMAAVKTNSAASEIANIEIVIFYWGA